MQINGNLKFSVLGSGELQNAIIERLSSAPTGVAGRLYYNTTLNGYFYYNGSSWQQFTGKVQFNYSSALNGGPTTSFTVSHNLNQQYVNVTVYDSTFNQIIPQNIVLTDANTVTVTLNTAIDVIVVVMGTAGIPLA